MLNADIRLNPAYKRNIYKDYAYNVSLASFQMDKGIIYAKGKEERRKNVPLKHKDQVTFCLVILQTVIGDLWMQN